MENQSILAKRSELHLMRRVWHILVGVLCLVAYYYLDHNIMHYAHFSIGIALLGFFVDFQRLKNHKLNAFLEKHFGSILSFQKLLPNPRAAAIHLNAHRKKLTHLEENL